MTLDECYRMLDLERGASQEEVRRAHRDLTKVWHPDRFGHDAALRRKAEEKLKAINQAYEAIRAARPGAEDDHRPPASHARARAREQEVRSRMLAIACGLAAAFLLFRRPTPAGLAIAVVLVAAAFFFVARMRRSGGG